MVTFSSATAAGTIIVEVGRSAKRYHLHKALLTHESEFFKKALTGGWKEAQEGVVRLDDVEIETFETFISYLYSRSIFDGHPCNYDCYETSTATSRRCLEAIRAYALADRLLAAGYRRAANNELDSMLDHIKLSPKDFFDLVNLAFELIPPEKPILQRLVDEYCAGGIFAGEEYRLGECVEGELELPAVFMRRVVHRFREMVGREGCGEGGKYPACYSWPRCYREHSHDLLGGDNRFECNELHMVWDEEKGLGSFPRV